MSRMLLTYVKKVLDEFDSGVLDNVSSFLERSSPTL